MHQRDNVKAQYKCVYAHFCTSVYHVYSFCAKFCPLLNFANKIVSQSLKFWSDSNKLCSIPRRVFAYM